MSDTPLPATVPALIAGYGRVSLLTPDGELLELERAGAVAMLREMPPPLVVHGPSSARRLGLRGIAAYDLLELFAFVMPARAAAPTPRGLALALGIEPGAIGTVDASLLPELAAMLLERAEQLAHTPSGAEMAALALGMRKAGWSWGAPLCDRLGVGAMLAPEAMQPVEALRVWRRLPKWEDTAARPAPAQHAVAPAEARARLTTLLGRDAEQRVGQADYADAAAAAFAPRLVRGDPLLVLAEAGTGTGKTLGYVAPASLWAERNGGTVWISTYTRHLQRQIEAELARLHPDPAVRRQHVVLRKGRENYLCLLNLEEAVNAAASRGGDMGGDGGGSVVPLSLLVRWASATADGDVLGGDLPGWFGELFGPGAASGLADRRGECIHGACSHYTRCFIEHGIRRARDADLVVANHALVMTQAAWHGQFGAGADEDSVPTRYVFDEGHHLLEAADGAFSAELSGLEAAELRRWLLGAEGSRSRARGLRRRLDELVAGQPALETPLDAALLASRALPAPGWSQRLGEDEALPLAAAADGGNAAPENPTEALLRLLRRQVMARGAKRSETAGASQECDLYPVDEGLAASAARLERALLRIAEPLGTLVERLSAKLEEDADTLDSAMRGRIEAMCRTIRRRALSRLDGWTAMLRALPEPVVPGVRPSHVMFLRLHRRLGGAVGGLGGSQQLGGCRAAPALAGPDAAVRGGRGGAGARAADHLGDVAGPAGGRGGKRERGTGLGRGGELAQRGGAGGGNAPALAAFARRTRQPVRLPQAGARLRGHGRGA